MNRRDFLTAVAGVSAAGLMPSKEAAAKSKKAWDVLAERYDHNVLTVYQNNIRQYWMEQAGRKCQDCATTTVKSLASTFDPDFIQQVFEKAQAEELTNDLLGGLWVVGDDNEPRQIKFTIEAMELPAALMKRGDRSVPVVASTRKLRARWSPNLAGLEDLHGIDLKKELTKTLTDQIALDIRLEMAADRKDLDPEDELVFCPYIMPLMTPTLYTKDDFTPRKGCLMRYAKVVFPKSGEPRVIETPLAHSEDYELKT